MSVDRNNKTRLHYILKATYKEQRNKLWACQWSLRKLGTIGNASVEGLKGKVLRKRHRRRREVDSAEGWPPPQPNMESGEGRELPLQDPGQRADWKQIWLLHCCLVLYWWQLFWLFLCACFILESSTIRSATANRSRVSIRVEELFGQGRWRGRPLSNRL